MRLNHAQRETIITASAARSEDNYYDNYDGVIVAEGGEKVKQRSTEPQLVLHYLLCTHVEVVLLQLGRWNGEAVREHTLGYVPVQHYNCFYFLKFPL